MISEFCYQRIIISIPSAQEPLILSHAHTPTHTHTRTLDFLAAVPPAGQCMCASGTARMFAARTRVGLRDAIKGSRAGGIKTIILL